MNTLVINCGSSSIKFALIDEQDEVLVAGKHERLLDADTARMAREGRTHESAIADILNQLQAYRIDIVGHRIVHGGGRHAEPCLIDESVLADIERHVPDAPMHNPYSLAAIHAARTALPEVPQVAMFDTAFHARMPRRSTTYAIDHEVAQRHGIRRYGFHGISHEYAAGIAAGFLQRPLNELRLITLHLGNGASACAVEFGRSAETSMGNTPLEGLVMGTRSGDVDAGVLLSLLRQGYDVAALDELLNRRSGLAGLSGLGNDLREIERAAAEGNDRARLAINVFAHRARKYIGAYAAAMGGVDAIVFTGGIGENSASMRGRILQRLEFLGVVLDEDRNRDASVRDDSEHALITTPRSRVEAIVVKTNEELMIAQQARRIIHGAQPNPAKSIPIAVSGRHCHLTAATFEALFGKGATPTLDKPLSQPGQFACKERVDLIGPRDRIDGVRVLGPLRSIDQVEISRTDEFRLGVDAPVRNSGNVKGSAPITLQGPAGTVTLPEGLICARRHIHMHPDDAARFAVQNKDEVSVSIVGGDRDLVFGDVLVRVDENFVLEMHIDTDEANAALLNHPTRGSLSVVDVDDQHYQPVSDVSGSLLGKPA
ncbi:acetate/propionate family kinase [Granulosicoccus sp. 3-233]|uniref:acetate/propionate family kinase n=1 Tax=Granulosicoccus sp. 3-233 TaxID=3417969 RepID=UPI003D33BA30